MEKTSILACFVGFGMVL